jgi:hypothetical protein
MATRTRDGKGRYIRTIKTVKRDFDAAELRAAGMSLERIAAALGFASRGHAHDAIARALRDTPYDGAEDDKLLDLMRIDRLIEQAWTVMHAKHVTVSHGKIIVRQVGVERDEDGIERLDMDGQPIPVYEDVIDDAPVLAAIREIRQLVKRRAEIIGYDAPLKTRIEVITEDAVDAECERLLAEIAEREKREAAAADTGAAG